jgi:hypothetical protein
VREKEGFLDVGKICRLVREGLGYDTKLLAQAGKEGLDGLFNKVYTGVVQLD